MQSDYVIALNALASACVAMQGSPFVILSGCEQSGNTVLPGVCVVNGEPVYCAGGSGDWVRIVETPQNATFFDGSVKPVYFTRILAFQSGAGVIAWRDFVRIPKLATSTQGAKADSAIQSATIGGTAVTKAGTQLQLPAYPTTLPANGGNAATVGGNAPNAFATSAQGQKADYAIQSATIGGTTVTKVGTQLQLPAYPTTLPANGGNAATVGGNAPSAFATSTQGQKADSALQSKATGWQTLQGETPVLIHSTIAYMLNDIGQKVVCGEFTITRPEHSIFLGKIPNYIPPKNQRTFVSCQTLDDGARFYGCAYTVDGLYAYMDGADVNQTYTIYTIFI